MSIIFEIRKMKINCKEKVNEIADNTQLKPQLNIKERSHNQLKYMCSFCEKDFKRKDRLDRHIFIHTGIVRILKMI